MTTLQRFLAMKMMAVSLVALSVGAAHAQAQAYPSRPVTIVVGFAAGSTADLVARTLAVGLSERLGGNFVVDNKTGANGMLAATAVARAKPDGLTLLITTSSPLTVNPFIYKDLAYAPLKDFKFITPIVAVPLLVVVNPNNPLMKGVNTVQDLQKVGLAKADGLTYGSAGNGNLTHLAAAQLSVSLGFKSVHVPFRGSAPADAALLAGDIDYVVGPVASVPLIKDGKLKALAVTDSERWPALPDVPSVTDLKMPEMGIVAWTALLAPAGTPDEIINALNKEIRAMTADPKLRATLSAQGRVWALTPAEFAKRVEDESRRYSELVKRIGVKAE